MWITLKSFEHEAALERLRKRERALIHRLPPFPRRAGPIDWPRFERRLRRIDELQALQRWLRCWMATCQGFKPWAWQPLA